MDSENPQKVPLPPIYEERLSSFQKICLAKVLRDSKVLLYIKIFVSQELGAQFIESPPFELKGPLMSSTCVSPIIFVLTPGSAPI
jgi:dynein heavy chain